MMNLAINDQRLTKPGPQNAALRDYDLVRRAIAFISEHWRAQPTIEAMADAAAVTPDELHHLFRRWAGLTPKAFMQALTLDHAKGLLRDSASVLDAALDSGLSGPGRLHDLFVTHEAMSPGEWKNGGAGMTLRYGFHPSPFGTAIVIASGRGLAGPCLRRSRRGAGIVRRHEAALAERHLCRGPSTARRALAQRIFDTRMWRADQPLRVVLIGTDFEVRVWETLLKIPMGRAVCYSDIATKIENPKASRAVGAAIGTKSGVVRGALPSRARQRRRADRLSLGHHPQAGDARLGSRTGRIALDFRRKYHYRKRSGTQLARHTSSHGASERHDLVVRCRGRCRRGRDRGCRSARTSSARPLPRSCRSPDRSAVMSLQRPSLMPATRRIAGLLVMWNSDRSIRYMDSDTSSSISTWPSRSGCSGVPSK